MTGETFLASVERLLVSELNSCDVVLIDDLCAQQVAGIAAAVRGTSSSLNLTSCYSPTPLNPIEKLIATTKAHLREASMNYDVAVNQIGDLH